MIRRFSTLAFVAGAITATGVYADSPTADPELERVRAELVERFEELRPESITRSSVKGLLEIRQGPLIAYVTEDGRYLIQGEVIDLVENRNLTQASMDSQRRAVIGEVENEDTIMFSPANPKHVVTVFTDVDCVYCRRLHQQIDDYQARGIAVRYLMYPRSGPNSPSWEKAEKVWCADDRNEAITLAKNDKPVEAPACDAAAAINEQFALGHAVGLRGTPAIVTDSGQLFSGYLPPAELAARLEETEQKTD